jgi:hypothetical protein
MRVVVGGVVSVENCACSHSHQSVQCAFAWLQGGFITITKPSLLIVKVILLLIIPHPLGHSIIIFRLLSNYDCYSIYLKETYHASPFHLPQDHTIAMS